MAAHATNGNGATVNRAGLIDEAARITDAVSMIAQITDEVSQGADLQVRSLDSALSGINELSASLKETATQAEAASTATDALVSSVNEVAASIEQVASSTDSLSIAVRQVTTSMVETSASIDSVATTAAMTTAATAIVPPQTMFPRGLAAVIASVLSRTGVGSPSASTRSASSSPALAYRFAGSGEIARSTTRTNAVGRSARASRSRVNSPLACARCSCSTLAARTGN